MSLRRAIALLFVASGCATVPPVPMHPEVLVAEPSEATSDRLHSACDLVASRNSGTIDGARTLAAQLGANVVMPLGGVLDRESRTDSTYRTVQSGNTVTTYVTTTTSNWRSDDTFYAMFRCASPPVGAP